MVVTDLDGTLLNTEHQISEINEQTLHRLGEKK
ncbi:HAD hydrolase family protein, partial [candidate division KSB1 bacterium]|nr:HAD hydrolase family protein [candidate division KSB1 bacterium]